MLVRTLIKDLNILYKGLDFKPKYKDNIYKSIIAYIGNDINKLKLEDKSNFDNFVEVQKYIKENIAQDFNFEEIYDSYILKNKDKILSCIHPDYYLQLNNLKCLSTDTLKLRAISLIVYFIHNRMQYQSMYGGYQELCSKNLYRALNNQRKVIKDCYLKHLCTNSHFYSLKNNVFNEEVKLNAELVIAELDSVDITDLFKDEVIESYREYGDFVEEMKELIRKVKI